ncbi:MAG: hypothetical protein HY291_12900 [Planctomycetes bacterium]|nr:hypothetical protein [Planctomycetota bacterium]
MSETNEELPRELQRIGAAVQRLPRPQPPADLAGRTLARIDAGVGSAAAANAAEPLRPGQAAKPLAPERRRSWWLRKITNPLARAAAMLLLAVMMGLVVNLDTAERIGRASERLLGTKTTDRVEGFLDRVFVAFGPAEVSDRDVANLAGLRDLPKNDLPPAPHRKPPETRPTTLILPGTREA